ncbi:MAG: hypothetical protein ACLQDV_14585, partial [Candidatus Binataceae bacterium]
MNSNRHTPALDDGTGLRESVAINLYLADKYGTDPFFFEGVKRITRALFREWSIICRKLAGMD